MTTGAATDPSGDPAAGPTATDMNKSANPPADKEPATK